MALSVRCGAAGRRDHRDRRRTTASTARSGHLRGTAHGRTPGDSRRAGELPRAASRHPSPPSRAPRRRRQLAPTASARPYRPSRLMSLPRSPRTRNSRGRSSLRICGWRTPRRERFGSSPLGVRMLPSATPVDIRSTTLGRALASGSSSLMIEDGLARSGDSAPTWRYAVPVETGDARGVAGVDISGPKPDRVLLESTTDGPAPRAHRCARHPCGPSAVLGRTHPARSRTRPVTARRFRVRRAGTSRPRRRHGLCGHWLGDAHRRGRHPENRGREGPA